MINFIKKFYTREVTIKKLVGSLLGLSIGQIVALLNAMVVIFSGGTLTWFMLLPLFVLPVVALALVILWFHPEIKHWFSVIRRHTGQFVKKIRRLFNK